jgi:CBS domain-containing protein
MIVQDILDHNGRRVRTVYCGVGVLGLIDQLLDDNVSALVVLDDTRSIVGVLSEREIVTCVASRGAEGLRMSVEQCMTRQAFWCSPKDSLVGVSSVMAKRNLRFLPVSTDQRVVGLISQRDLLAFKHGTSQATRVPGRRLALVAPTNAGI